MKSGDVILILGVLGLGVGAFWIMTRPAPKVGSSTGAKKPGATGSTGSGSYLDAANAFIAIGKNLLGGSPSTGSGSGGGSPGTYYPTVNTYDTKAEESYAISHGVTDLEGNQIIDLNTGDALVYGVSGTDY